MNTVSERLRELADALEGCDWILPLGSAQLCKDAADMIDQAESSK